MNSAHPIKDEAGAPGTGTAIVLDLDAGRKSFVTLQARYAMAGFALIEMSDGTLLATRWNCCRPLPDLAAASRFLKLIGGQQ
jgi:hypothetical protein